MQPTLSMNQHYLPIKTLDLIGNAYTAHQGHFLDKVALTKLAPS